MTSPAITAERAGVVVLAWCTLLAMGLAVSLPVLATSPMDTTTESSLSLSATQTTSVANGTVTVRVEVTNTGDTTSVGTVVRLSDVPPGWRVVNQSSGNGTYRASTREWLWPRLQPGTSRSASVRLAVPANASERSRMTFWASDAANATASTTATVNQSPLGTNGSGGTTTMTVPFKSGRSETDGFPTLLISLLVVVVLGGGIAYRRYG